MPFRNVSDSCVRQGGDKEVGKGGQTRYPIAEEHATQELYHCRDHDSLAQSQHLGANRSTELKHVYKMCSRERSFTARDF